MRLKKTAEGCGYKNNMNNAKYNKISTHIVYGGSEKMEIYR
jgi:hypothetical protein